MAADVSGLLEQLLRSDAGVHGTRSFGSDTDPIATSLPGGRPFRRRARSTSGRRSRLVWASSVGQSSLG
jgi:hypothetical protein